MNARSAVRILLVRAVNVGGTGKLPMPRFRAMLEELGATEVRTYIASGNAVARVPGGAGFDRKVEKALESEFDLRREVISRTPAQLEKALEAHPFEVVEDRHSYICALTARPDAAHVRAAAEVPTGSDEWRLVGSDLHLRFADGAGRADLDLHRLLKALGVQGTARNLRTVRKLVELARS